MMVVRQVGARATPLIAIVNRTASNNNAKAHVVEIEIIISGNATNAAGDMHAETEDVASIIKSTLYIHTFTLFMKQHNEHAAV